MHRPIEPNHLRLLRLKHGFSQVELGTLLGVSGSTVSKYERSVCRMPLDVVLSAEVVLGSAPRNLLPRDYESIEDAVIARGLALYEALERRTHAEDRGKEALLLAMIERAKPRSTDL